MWRFIMDRQIEAPDEFATLQTHRVQLAVARRQLAFVEQLAEVCRLAGYVFPASVGVGVGGQCVFVPRVRAA